MLQGITARLRKGDCSILLYTTAIISRTNSWYQIRVAKSTVAEPMMRLVARYNMKAEQHKIERVAGCLLLGCIIDEDVQLRYWSSYIDKDSIIVTSGFVSCCYCYCYDPLAQLC